MNDNPTESSSIDMEEEDNYSENSEHEAEVTEICDKYPFEKWGKFIKKYYSANSINEGVAYYESVSSIFKYEVFESENFNTNNLILFYEKIGQISLFDIMQSINLNFYPNFVIKNIEKSSFSQIMQERNYMLKNSENLDMTKKYKYVSIIGEIITDITTINNEIFQKKIDFCKIINDFQKDVYFIILIIFGDYSFKNLLHENILNGPFITCYIPKNIHTIATLDCECNEIKKQLIQKKKELEEIMNREIEKVTEIRQIEYNMMIERQRRENFLISCEFAQQINKIKDENLKILKSIKI